MAPKGISSMTSPAVSIVMPSRNHGRYIGRAIEAILSQSYRNFELLVMDYDSRDATWDILRSIRDSRVHASAFSEPGMGKALNAGMRMARGRYLTWAHTDNIPYPDWLSTLTKELDSNPNVDFVYSDFEVINAEGKTVQLVQYGPFDPDRLLAYCLVGPTFLYRREIHETVGNYLEEHPRDDHDYWCRAWQAGFTFKNVPLNLGKLRFHEATRMERMRDEYDASLKDLISRNIHEAQSRGAELFRIRDRPQEVLAEYAESQSRLRSRIRYFVDMFLKNRPGARVAVYGEHPTALLVLDILDELGSTVGIVSPESRAGRRLGINVLPAGEAAGFFDFILVCEHDEAGAARNALEAEGVERRKIVHVFLSEAAYARTLACGDPELPAERTKAMA